MRRGDFIYCEGDPLDVVDAIVDGRVKEIRETEDGEAVIIRLDRSGDILGMIGAGTLQGIEQARWPKNRA